MWYYLFYVISEITQHSESFFFIYNFVTVQYLHSYDAKSIPNRLRRWDFALLNHYLTVSAVNASTYTE